ncbi:MAG: hypothetical protein NUV57_00235 [archaeon]|nr:hypothetical protein [archaeon]
MAFDIFYLHVFLSFVFGGLAVAVALSMAERFGERIGAVLLSFPTSSVVSLFFIGIVGSGALVIEVIPFSFVSLAIYLLFIFVFILLAERFGRKSILAGFAVWLSIALPIAFFWKGDFWISLVVFFAVYLFMTFWRFEKKLVPLVKTSFDFRVFLYRVFFAGLLVAFAVFSSKVFGPEWGGLFSMFPASTTSAYWLLLKSHPPASVVSVARKMLPYSVTFAFYAFAVYFLYPLLGLYIGTLVCIALTGMFALVLFTLLKNQPNG